MTENKAEFIASYKKCRVHHPQSVFVAGNMYLGAHQIHISKVNRFLQSDG
jgi:hypothetical protein